MKKFLLTILILGGLWNMTNAFVLDFINLTMISLQERFSEVHFVAPGNDFGGLIFWLSAYSLPNKVSITLPSGQTKYCKKLVRGMYYNSQRGERVRPLDEFTRKSFQSNSGYDDLSLTGGLYSACDNDPYSIYGQLKFSLPTDTDSYLIAGLKLDFDANYYIGAFAKNFQYFDNKIPLGYLWDSLGGIGFVGGYLSGDENLITYLNNSGITINKAFAYNTGQQEIISNTGFWYFSGAKLASGASARNTSRNMCVFGKTILGQSINPEERRSILGNFGYQTSVSSSSDTNASTLINQVKQKIPTICRSRQSQNLNDANQILCFANTGLVIEDYTNIQGKTIVVQNGSITFKKSMEKNQKPINIFVDKGNIYLSSGISNLQSFDNNGYIDGTELVSSGVYFKGNIIVNGLIVGTGSNGFEFPHRIYIYGKVTTLNTPVAPSEGRVSQIEKILGTGFSNGINFQDVFTWFCNSVTGLGTDQTFCGSENGICAGSPIIIIDETFQTLW